MSRTVVRLARHRHPTIQSLELTAPEALNSLFKINCLFLVRSFNVPVVLTIHAFLPRT
jgi:hypothetical protein